MLQFAELRRKKNRSKYLVLPSLFNSDRIEVESKEERPVLDTEGDKL